MHKVRHRAVPRRRALLGGVLVAALLAVAPGGAAIAQTPAQTPAQPPSGGGGAADGARSGQSSSLPSRVGVLTWNICGALKEDGDNSCPGSSSGKVDELVNRVKRNESTTVIMVQETCESLHSRPLETALNRETPGEWVVRHRTALRVGTDNPVVCPRSGKPEAGVAIAMKKLPGSDLVQDSEGKPGWDMTFPNTDEEETGTVHTQGAACLQDRGNRLLACASHFANANADKTNLREASARDFRDQARDWQNGGYRTIIGGDLNLRPDDDALQPLYEGNFEADSDRKCTTTGPWYLNYPTCQNPRGSKLDYIFFSDYGWDLVRGHPYYWGSRDYSLGRLSDHWMLWSVVRPSS
ncbi:endonuclease/exonuclease/phosphatase family protein [Streptomyces boncukensis]|uniref:Endonuclease/exonuclease/phosphatase family protein n=1 Tax=Streptomyces boncukensis TaxID=2711219 RepID=A0A6G4X6A1_9ACTN|nr:endonuclease/exonuclease/phosphatase family protein [Streptomyces boncukensis]NGO73069.1 endonuclease/exonuclease/phosphatase family protein [Streptomyces boncukensis]